MFSNNSFVSLHYTCCVKVAHLEQDIFRVDFVKSISKYFAAIIYNFVNEYFFHVVDCISLCSAVSGK